MAGVAAEAASVGAGADDTLIAAAASVFLYALPLYEIARARGRAMAAGQRENRLYHGRKLADARARLVTTPNTDTLYSVAWLDLAAGPVEIDLPPPSGRYVSLALMDAFSNNFAVLHPEDAGAGRITLSGPGAVGTAAAGRLRIVSPTAKVWALARVYVAGDADLASAHAVQDAFRLAAQAAPGGPEALLEPPVRGEPARIFPAMAALVDANPKPDEDAHIRAALAALGLAPGGVPGGMMVSGAVLAAGRAAALGRMREPAAAPDAGWLYPKDNLGAFGRDYLFRAQVAIGGLAALPVREALYLRATDGAARLFRGPRARRLVLSAGASPPVGAFWSLTLYEPDGTGGLYFFDTPTRVYAIKDGDPGFRRRADGSVVIVIAAERPAEPDVNWLPAPAGAFALIFRAYRPGAALLDRSYRLPPVLAEGSEAR